MRESERGESCGGNGWQDVLDGAASDVALFVEAESLRSLALWEIVASIGVVCRGFRWLPIPGSLKTRRPAKFDFTETAGCREFHRVTAGL